MPQTWNHRGWYGDLTEQELGDGCTVTVPGVRGELGASPMTVLDLQHRRQRRLMETLLNARFHQGLVDLLDLPGLDGVEVRRTHRDELANIVTLRWSLGTTLEQEEAGEAALEALVRALPYQADDRSCIDQLYHGFKDDDELVITRDNAQDYLRSTLGDTLYRVQRQHREKAALIQTLGQDAPDAPMERSTRPRL